MAIKSAPPDRARLLWRLFGWGCAAFAAVALTSQTEAGSKRLQLALAYASEPGRAVAQIPPRAAEAEAETKRLVRHKCANWLPTAHATTPAVIAAVPPPVPSLPALTPLAMPAVSDTAASWPATATTRQAAKPATPPVAAEPAAEAAPLPPVHVAATPALEHVAPPPAKTDYGIDLGAGRQPRSAAHPLGGVAGQLRTAAGGPAPGSRAAPEVPVRRNVSPDGGAAAERN